MPGQKPGARGDGVGKGDALAARCAAIPGKMAAQGIAWAHQELDAILTAKQHKSILPGTGKRGNVMANLWFMRAAHEFAAAALAPAAHATPETRAFVESLLPLCKSIIQEFISDDGMNGVRMDDSGMLAGADDTPRDQTLRLNALWYAALEMTGQALRGQSAMGKANSHVTTAAHKHTGDHFERLAGRFRRAFAKLYWCDEHGRICPPHLREDPSHGSRPDGEQLLLTHLSASPLPRTKQREILGQFESRAGDGIGLPVEHPEHGAVQSPLYRAWLAAGFAADGDAAKAHKTAIHLAPLVTAARSATVFALYRGTAPLSRQPDPFISAEVLGILHRVGIV